MRRFRSARKRPGAGELPALAPGRTRARMGDGAMRLGRAPREVYRVYNEREFFADEAHERFDVERAVAGGRRLQRLAGVTVLLATVGAVGGLLAAASLPSLAGGRRRGGGRLSADVASRTGVTLPTRRRQLRSRRLDASIGNARAANTAGAAVRVNAPRRGTGIARVRQGAAGHVVRAAREVPANVELAASATDASRATAVAARPSGQIEFGFER